VLASAIVVDPVSWLQIAPGWSVVASDGAPVGEVLSVSGDKSHDIFDGLAIRLGASSTARYVAAEQVGVIHPGEVTLGITSAEAEGLALYEEPPSVTVWRPEAPSRWTRLSNWFRGK
jgi:hypothetical protein